MEVTHIAKSFLFFFLAWFSSVLGKYEFSSTYMISVWDTYVKRYGTICRINDHVYFYLAE